jgi:O-antigen/teichoic acid export membrane protein
MNPEHRIVRNSVVTVFGQIIGGGLIFLVALLSARYLDPERFGVFSFCFAAVAVVHMFAGGFTNILVREIARDLSRLEGILGAAIPLMTLVSVLAWLLTFVCVSLSSLTAETSTTIYILATSFPVSFHSAVYAAVCRAHEEMTYNALGLILQRLVLLSSVLITILLDLGLVGVAVSYLVAYVFQWLYYSVLVSRRYCQYRPCFDFRLWRHLTLEGIPLVLGMMMQRIASYIDIFILTMLSTASSVGLYSAAYRLLEMLSLIPTTISQPLFPALSRLAAESNEEAYSLYLKALKFLIIIGLPLGIWLFVTAPQLMTLLFSPDYSQAGSTLRILGIMLVFVFVNSLYLYLFSAIREQRLFTIIISIVVVLNIILDVLLIPVLDFFGAALATLGSEIVLFVIGSYLLVSKGLMMRSMLQLWKVLPGLLVATLVLFWPVCSPSYYSLILGTIGFGVVYLAAIYMLKLIGRSELMTLWSLRPRGDNSTDSRFTQAGQLHRR